MAQRQIDATDSATDAEADSATGARTEPATDPSEHGCPECDAPCVVRDGGCPTCRACGWSKCAYSPP